MSNRNRRKKVCICRTCNEQKLHEARGMCIGCYYASRRLEKSMPKRRSVECVRCCKTKPHSAFGMCEHCRVVTRSKREYDIVKRKGHLRRVFGMSLEQYNAMIDFQAGLCAICCEPMNPKADTQVDHCHRTGFVRGLLCSHCNLTLGRMHDAIEIFSHATDYLCAHFISN
jgi:hypothetical protein